MPRSFTVQIAAALILICQGVLADPSRAVYLGSFRWHMNASWFGGFSGIELSSNGQTMTVISDRGKILTARIERTATQIAAIRPGKPRHLKSSTGARVSGRIGDVEGLVVAPDGSLYISFEGIARVAHYDTAADAAIPLHRPASFAAMPLNGSLEALAMDPRGRLYTLPERGADQNGKIPVYRWDGDRWSTPFTLPARDGFLPVGADFGPDGRFYLLERTVSIFGFRSRIRRWDITETRANNERILLQTSSGTHDNLEGLSIWRDASGNLRATMISDDNFIALQTTEIVEYSLTE